VHPPHPAQANGPKGNVGSPAAPKARPDKGKHKGRPAPVEAAPPAAQANPAVPAPAPPAEPEHGNGNGHEKQGDDGHGKSGKH
jgi:hypothetical protein